MNQVLVPYYHDPKQGGCGVTTPLSVPRVEGSFTFDVVCAGCGEALKFPLNIGMVEKQLFHAFGDESYFKDTVIYAFVTFHDHDLQKAEAAFSELKTKYKVPSLSEFHAKEALYKGPGSSSEWSHLSHEQIFDFMHETISTMRIHRADLRIAAANINEFPKEFKKAGDLPAGPMGPKQLVVMLSSILTQFLTNQFGKEGIVFYYDPDHTKIDWFGVRRKVHGLFQSMSPNDPPKFEIAPADKRPMVQLADMLSYVASHSLSNEECSFKKDFRKLYKLYKPTLASFSPNPNAKIHNGALDCIVQRNHDKILNTIRTSRLSD